MLDIKYIRNNALEIQNVCADRGVDVDIPMLIALDSQRAKLLSEVERLRSKGNAVASEIASAEMTERSRLIEEGKQLKIEIKIVEDLLNRINEQHRRLLMSVPNLFANDTPRGKDGSENVEIVRYGTEPQYDFEPKDHIALATSLGMDFAAGARVAGAGFPIMSGSIALLESALLRFVYDQAVGKGFTPVNVPLLARINILEGLGFNPRRDDDGTEIFSTIQDNLCLAGTAEISLVGQFENEILGSELLPKKLVAMTPCFRREGAAGRRDAGLYRNKMFNKVELVMLSTEDQTEGLLEEIRGFETDVFNQLGFYFRVIRICAGDLGAPAFKKYDLEAWMMGRGVNGAADWGEVTSCSNCTDFQARRLNIRYKDRSGKLRFVNTLNGTGITSRALIPLLEQNQTFDGKINIPAVLRPYLNGRAVI